MVVLVQVCGFAHVRLSLCVDLFIEHLLCESYSSSILSPCPVPGARNEALGTEAKVRQRVPSLECGLWPGGEPAVSCSIGEWVHCERKRAQRPSLVEGWEGPGGGRKRSLGGEVGKIRVCWST